MARAKAPAFAHVVVKETGDGPAGGNVGNNIYGCGVEVLRRQQILMVIFSLLAFEVRN